MLNGSRIKFFVLFCLSLWGTFCFSAEMSGNLTKESTQKGLAINEKMIKQAQKGEIDTARASWWGFNPKDSTNALQAAFRSGVRKLVIDRQTGPWIVRPLFLASDQEIILEEGVEILAQKDEFHGTNDALLTIKDVENVTVRGQGKGAILRMRKTDYQSQAYSKAEWRHCILIRSSKNVRIENLVLTESGGDGICIGGQRGGNRQSENITVKKVICLANHRQGISVGSSVNLLIEDTILKNTSGTAPQAGIDFEPDIPQHHLVNVVMRNCISENNRGSGYDFYLVNMNNSGVPVSFVLENCVSRNNRGAAIALTVRNRKEGMLQGSFLFKNCLFDNDGSGIHISGNPIHGPKIVFENTTLNWRMNESDSSKPLWNSSPLQLQTLSEDEEPFGNINFGNFNIRYKSKSPFISFHEQALYESGAKEMTGHFQIEQNGIHKITELDNNWCQSNCPASNSPRLPLIDASSLKLIPVDQTVPGFTPKDPISVLPVKIPRRFLCYTSKGKEVVFGIKQFRFGIQPVHEVTLRLISPSGKKSVFKIKPSLNEENEFRWLPKETGVWSIIPNKDNHILGITRSTAPIAVSFMPSFDNVRGPGRFYFYVPQGTKQFGFRIVGSDYSPVKVALYDPSGKLRWANDSVNKGENWFSGAGKTAIDGIWSFTLSRTKERPFTSCSVFLPGIPALVGSSPNMLLRPDPQSSK